MKNGIGKILLVEDDKFISRAFKDGLTRAGFEVVQAVDGVDALEKVRTDSPDLMLLDLIMPTKNGFDVLEEMKAKNLKKFPVIILSNLGQELDIKKAKEFNADDYLIKSNVTLKEVVDKVKSFLK